MNLCLPVIYDWLAMAFCWGLRDCRQTLFPLPASSGAGGEHLSSFSWNQVVEGEFQAYWSMKPEPHTSPHVPGQQMSMSNMAQQKNIGASTGAEQLLRAAVERGLDICFANPGEWGSTGTWAACMGNGYVGSTSSSSHCSHSVRVS
jgi:hypothetical protein